MSSISTLNNDSFANKLLVNRHFSVLALEALMDRSEEGYVEDILMVSAALSIFGFSLASSPANSEPAATTFDTLQKYLSIDETAARIPVLLFPFHSMGHLNAEKSLLFSNFDYPLKRFDDEVSSHM